MRYASFMIECGIEEEDWSGPDVDPVPWLVSQLPKEEQEKILDNTGEQMEEAVEQPKEVLQMSKAAEEDEVEAESKRQLACKRRKPPSRTRSMELMSPTKRNSRPERRGRVRPTTGVKKTKPRRTDSMNVMLSKIDSIIGGPNNNDDGDDDNAEAPSARGGVGLSLARDRGHGERTTSKANAKGRARPARPEMVQRRRTPPTRGGGFTATKSGSDLGTMRASVTSRNMRSPRQLLSRKGSNKDDGKKKDEVQMSGGSSGETAEEATEHLKPFKEVRGRLKLTAAKSGSLHHMRQTMAGGATATKNKRVSRDKSAAKAALEMALQPTTPDTTSATTATAVAPAPPVRCPSDDDISSDESFLDDNSSHGSGNVSIDSDFEESYNDDEDEDEEYAVALK